MSEPLEEPEQEQQAAAPEIGGHDSAQALWTVTVPRILIG